MIGNGNNRINNINDIINRRSQQYQDINDLGGNPVPKPKFYQNALNMNKIIQSGNNSMNKQNIRMNRNMNINVNKNNMNNMNILNIININKNNMNKMNILNKMNINKNNKSNNKVRYIHNMTIQNNNINKALMVLRNEFKKKDDRIKALELKVAELENKINMITNSGNYYQLSENNNNNNSNIINLTRKFTSAEKYADKINSNYIKRESLNKTPEVNYARENNPFRYKDDNQNMNNNNYYNQIKSANQYKIKQNNNDNNNEFIMENKNNNINNLNDARIEGSTYTGNSGSLQRHSKNDVKIFLKEVKSKVDPPIFKEFIQNIKLLTNAKDKKSDVDKNTVIEKVRLLFGEQFKDLFIKFESIIGITN